MLGSKQQRTEGMRRQAQELIDQAYERGFKDGKEAFVTTEAKVVNEAYQKGLNDALEAASKICAPEQNGGLSWDALISIFGICSFDEISHNYTASEVVAKIKAYEERKKAEDEELKVGTRVRTTKDKDFNGEELFPVGTVGVIEEINTSYKLPYKISANGEYWYYTRDMFEVIDDEIVVGDEVIDLTFPEPEKAIVIRIYDKKISVMWDDGSIGTWPKSDFEKTGRHFPQISEVLKQLQEGE